MRQEKREPKSAFFYYYFEQLLVPVPWELGPLGQVGLIDTLEVVVFDNTCGLFSVIGAEDEDSLAAQQERVHVGDADASLAEDLNGFCGTTGLVVNLDGEYIAKSNSHACLLQFFASTQGLAADEAIDTILCRIGNGGGNNLNLCFLQGVQHLDERT